MDTRLLTTQIVVAVVAIAAIFGHSLSPAFQGELATAIMATLAVGGTIYGIIRHRNVSGPQKSVFDPTSSKP